jgi:hypothetical protein
VSGPPLYGAVRINGDYPLVVPEMAAIAGATQSFSRKYVPLAYR